MTTVAGAQSPQASPPTERPMRLIAAQQLAMAAYPELRGSRFQIRVDERPAGETRFTFAPAERDSETTLALSRPRTALLVIDATFDGEQRVARATLHGAMARSKERREVSGRAAGWDAALGQARAAYPPSKRREFLQQLDRDLLHGIVGRLTTTGATFQDGIGEDGVYWDVAATAASGERIVLRFEPFGGRLIGFARGDGQ